jgi:uncharacterized protein DUF397
MSLNNLEVEGLQWRKARRSIGNGACVEVAPAGRRVLVRDSQDRNGALIQYPECSWRAFVAGMKSGKPDRDRP